MLKILAERIKQGKRTIAFPGGEPKLPDRFRGLPVIDVSRCSAGCSTCVEVCPTGALTMTGKKAVMDIGRCLFCTGCETACPNGAIKFSQDFRLAARNRNDLKFSGGGFRPAQALDKNIRRIFGKSLKLREISAGGCNACEADVNVLGTTVFDIGRFGIQFVASPRHADGILVTGPVTKNMRDAVMETYEATPQPRLVIAAGSCAISGGPYIGHKEVENGLDTLILVDLYVPGCPPHPLTILDGILRLLGKIK
ncbi:MAG: NADH-quinone oxidoreductase subunit NuoB [Desulfobacteraceae bacterium]|nr:NADH-quinone oxidoreductase subunit NuoB [Desulfobacteraceae bacterium]